MNSASQSTSPELIPSTGSVVLCGGKSSRMGAPKMWLPFGDEIMLQRITRILFDVARPVVVVAAADQDLPDLHPEILICRDEFPDKGPLSGIYSGLKKLSELDVESAFVTACDSPFLKPEFVRFLAGSLNDIDDLVVLNDGKYSYVLSAVYRTRIYREAKQLLDYDQLRPIGLQSVASARILDIEQARSADPDLSSLLNLNSPEDYDLALERLKQETSKSQ